LREKVDFPDPLHPMTTIRFIAFPLPLAFIFAKPIPPFERDIFFYQPVYHSGNAGNSN
jgi:hypothetical protein